MLRAPIVDQDSLCSVSLKMLFKETLLAKGTGFFWKIDDGVALVTAWHNFSGLHHTTREALGGGGGMPDRIRMRYMASNPKSFQEHEIPLYIDEEMQRPRWFVHPECGSFFDVAALFLSISGLNEFNCVNERFSEPAEQIPMGSDLFVVGFPQGIGTLETFPVWKRASLATETSIPFGGHPKFLIDATGRGGMSGAPVYRIQRGIVPQQSGGFGLGTRKEFVGLYSGRAAITGAKESSELGFVWRSEVLRELFQNPTLDENPEPGKGRHEVTEFFNEPSSTS